MNQNFSLFRYILLYLGLFQPLVKIIIHPSTCYSHDPCSESHIDTSDVFILPRCTNGPPLRLVTSIAGASFKRSSRETGVGGEESAQEGA